MQKTRRAEITTYVITVLELDILASSRFEQNQKGSQKKTIFPEYVILFMLFNLSLLKWL